MDSENENALESRPPTIDDLLELCRRLNEYSVKYIVIGGMAIIHHGFVRATEDIDLLVACSPENEQRLKQALLYLPDRAACKYGIIVAIEAKYKGERCDRQDFSARTDEKTEKTVVS